MVGARILALALVLALAVPSLLAEQGARGPGWDAASIAAKQAEARRSPPRPKHPPTRGGRDRSTSRLGPSKRERAQRWEQKCDKPGSIKLPRSQECTHGSDPAPPGFEVGRRVAPLQTAAARAASAAFECDGDGRSGPRVQALYAHASNITSRYAEYLDSFRIWTADADTIMRESAAEAGGSRRFRFVTGSGCLLAIDDVTLTAAGDDNFDATISELKAQGYNRSDRKYLIYVDTTTAGICGIGSLWEDDDPGQANWNNYGPSYARADAGCWDGHTVAHELMHNLGAVQRSAPNESGGWHCVDEFDVMCYSDSPFYPTMRYDCLDPAHENRYDCGHDDYFDPAPGTGSYLATHWNAADNRFLVGGGNGPDDNAPPDVNWITPVGNGETYHASTGSLTLEASAVDDAGINRVEFWRYDDNGAGWIRLTTDRAAPYTADLNVADLNLGFNYLTATAYDGALNQTTASIWIERTDSHPEPPAIAITAPKPGAKLKGGASIPVEVAITGDIGAATVAVARCPGSSCAWATATLIGSDDSAPYNVPWQAPKKGTFTLLAAANSSGASPVVSEPVIVKLIKKKKGKR